MADLLSSLAVMAPLESQMEPDLADELELDSLDMAEWLLDTLPPSCCASPGVQGCCCRTLPLQLRTDARACRAASAESLPELDADSLLASSPAQEEAERSVAGSTRVSTACTAEHEWEALADHHAHLQAAPLAAGQPPSEQQQLPTGPRHLSARLVRVLKLSPCS